MSSNQATAVLAAATLLAIGLWIYVGTRVVLPAAGDEIARIVREVVKQECLK